MPTTPRAHATVELVYFAGCPHVEPARAALRRAFEHAGLAPAWQEWDQTAPNAPAHVQGLGSPTILVAGRDVTGVTDRNSGRACRADGIPAPEVIAAALADTRNA
ncbi:MAG: hypothetical protein LOY01_01665 [Brachybacterium paraconglomeratum]|jgi:hypothetical protein|nr:hypothetical protein [Brachybacterium paraconglomeratum]